MNTLALLTSLLLTAAPAGAEDTFVEAKRTYAALRADKSKRQQRLPYEKLLKQLTKASEMPDGRPAECAYFGATIAEDLYAASGVAADLDQAVALNVDVADRFADSSLADDALLRAARLLMSRKGDLEGARTLLVRAKKDYGNGDQSRAIAELLGRLPAAPAVEPKREPVAKTTVPAPVPAETDDGKERVEDILARFATRDGGPTPQSAATTAPAAEAPVASGPQTVAAHPQADAVPLPIKGVTIRSYKGGTELALSVQNPVEAREGTAIAAGKLPARYFVDVSPAKVGAVGKVLKAHKDARIQGVRVAQFDDHTVRIVFDLQKQVPGRAVFVAEKQQLIITVGEPPASKPPPAPPMVAQMMPPASEPREHKETKEAKETREPIVNVSMVATEPTKDAGPSLKDVQSLAKDLQGPQAVSLSAQFGTKVKRVVIDAGHGGDDPGAIGPSGIKEKDVTLKIAKRVAEKLRKELKMDVILTRDKDVFIPLEGRTAMANEAKADLFISIHCNSNPNQRIYGVETYYLNITDDNYAIRLAARENKTSEKSISDLQFILADLAMKSNVDDSARLSRLVQSNVVGELRDGYKDVKDLGVKHALFYVLIGAKMPAILVETSFVSNKMEEQRLSSVKYQDKLADGLVQGVRHFVEERQALAR